MRRTVLVGSAWTELPYTLKMQYTLDYFTGYRSALYHFTTLEEGGIADFDYFLSGSHLAENQQIA